MQFRTVTGYIRSHHWIVMLFLIVFSFFVLGTIFSGSRYCGYCNARLSEKEGTVLKLTTAATAAATALALVPDDSTTPVADQIMDLTDYGIIITVMILIERFLVRISGTLAFPSGSCYGASRPQSTSLPCADSPCESSPSPCAYS